MNQTKTPQTENDKTPRFVAAQFGYMPPTPEILGRNIMPSRNM